MKTYFISFCFFLFCINLFAQDIYKTPSGKKYHLSSCRMVENVSKKLVGKSDVSRYRLTPCKICKPPQKKSIQNFSSSSNKAVGISYSVQCKGKTKRGSRCKHKTKLANGYCYQHTSQNSQSKKTYKYNSNRPSKSNVSVCGARTKSGKNCRRKVKGSGYCYQHK